jgi:epoxyqueuosine reductase
MEIKQRIIDNCDKLGLDQVGFTKCRKFNELEQYFRARQEKEYENEFEEKDIEKRINPFFYMPEGKTIISIAFPYLYDLDFSSKVYFSKYTLGLDYHSVVKKYLQDICTFIQELGGECLYFVDDNSLPERYIAAQSGVGFIGKNNMLITEKYGSYVFLGEIITDLVIEPDEPKYQQCGECELCVKSCPTQALNDMNNSNICLSYITQKKDIEDIWFEQFRGRIFGCDTCQRVCPYNKEIKFSKLEEFKPFDYMNEVNLEELINMNNRVFNEKYKILSSGWRGKNIIKRNAMINAFYFGQKKLIDESKINSPYLKDYYNRLLNKFHL